MSAAKNLSSPKPEWLQVVQDQVGSLRFGIIQIVIHDSRVVQIEKTEKVRLDKSGERDASRIGSGESPGAVSSPFKNYLERLNEK